MNQTAQIRSEEIGTAVVVRVDGFLARLEVYKLRHEFDSLFDSGHKLFVLDLTKAQHIDSAGVGTLVKIRNTLNAGGGQLALIPPENENTKRILDVSSLKTIISFYDSETEALRALGANDNRTDSLAGGRTERPNAGSGDMELAVEELRARLQAVELRLSRLENRP